MKSVRPEPRACVLSCISPVQSSLLFPRGPVKFAFGANNSNPERKSIMSNLCERYKHSHLGALIFVLAFAPIAGSQQQADLTFDANVKNPAYTTTHPKVLIDEAHFNFHTASGRYKPFADLVSNDGYRVKP